MSDSSFDYLEGNYYISAASLLLEFRCFIDSHPTLFKLNIQQSVWPKMVNYCEELEKFPAIMRAITNLHINSQMDFERALFCAWCSLLVAKSLRLPVKNQRILFYAGILQDIGKYQDVSDLKMLSCKADSPFMAKLLNTSDKDMHPLISANFVEQHLSELNGLSELILTHHARTDGTGFPAHISESQLSLDNQVLIIANEISDRLDQLGGHNQLVHVMPNIRLNGFLYFQNVHQHWIKLFQPFLPGTKESVSDEIMLETTKAKITKLEAMHACLLVTSATLLPYDFEPKINILRSWVRRLATLSTDTGIFDPQLFSQLVGDDTNLATNVARDVDLILKGLPDLLKRLVGLVDDIMTSRKYDAYATLLQDTRGHLYRNMCELDSLNISIFR